MLQEKRPMKKKVSRFNIPRKKISNNFLLLKQETLKKMQPSMHSDNSSGSSEVEECCSNDTSQFTPYKQ